MHGLQAPFTPESLLSCLEPLPAGGRWWIAFSGGSDSTALMHAMTCIRETLPAPLCALHIDHGLHPQSQAWSERCEQVCREWSVPCRTERVHIDTGAGTGVEAAARKARYAVAAALLEDGDVLLTAHHADDQAETVLLNLMRGSGVDGLAGMPALRRLGPGWLARPLLSFPGASLRRYLEKHALNWTDDPSNESPAYDRNYLRHSLRPVLERRWPGSWHNLAQSAAHCREASEFIAQTCDEVLKQCLSAPGILDLDRLKRQQGSPTEKSPWKLLIRQWLRMERATSLPRTQLHELLRQLETAGPGRRIAVHWDDWVLQHYRAHLWLQRQEAMVACPERPWSANEPLELGDILGILTFEGSQAPPDWQLSIGPRQTGEQISSTGNHHRRVKDILRETGIPPWLRASVPILRERGRTVAIGPWAMAPDFRARLADAGLRLLWKPRDRALQYLTRRRPDERG